MSPRWSEAKIEEVQRANDIVEVISSYLPLKRSGKDFRACCPFHAEKTPSFFVSPSKQIFKCFGCGKGGSVFQFVMARENVTFPEAMKLLADRAGIVIEEPREARSGRDEPDRSRLLKAVAWAVEVFERFLRDPAAGRPAREYLSRRGFTDETVKRFRLGFAPDSWDGLLRAAAKRGVSEPLLLAAGLVVPRSEGAGYYDRFRNRVMFPIFDSLNRAIAFGGRTLGDDPAKYLNSPETAVFNKSQNLYGVTAARESMTSSRRAIVVEGYTDCLMAQQAGVTNVVATLGTSLTRSHVRLLKRYADEVVLVFDGDLAGRAAADRAVQIFLEEEVGVRIVTLPEGLDPCDFLAQGRKEEFERLVSSSPDALEFKWRLVRQEFEGADSVRGRRRAIEAMLEALAAQPAWLQSQDGLKRDLALARMAAVMAVEERSLRERLTALAKQARSQAGRQEAVEEAARDRQAGESRDLRAMTERLILQVLLASPDRISAVSGRLAPQEIKEEAHRGLYERLVALESRLKTEGISLLWGRLEDDERLSSLAAELVGMDEADDKLNALLEDSLATLKRLCERDEVEELRRQVAASTTEEERGRLLQRLQELRRHSRGFLPPGMTARK